MLFNNFIRVINVVCIINYIELVSQFARAFKTHPDHTHENRLDFSQNFIFIRPLNATIHTARYGHEFTTWKKKKTSHKMSQIKWFGIVWLTKLVQKFVGMASCVYVNACMWVCYITKREFNIIDVGQGDIALLNNFVIWRSTHARMHAHAHAHIHRDRLRCMHKMATNSPAPLYWRYVASYILINFCNVCSPLCPFCSWHTKSAGVGAVYTKSTN